jgi:hypothetical protein
LCLINIFAFIVASFKQKGCIEQVEERNANTIFGWKALAEFMDQAADHKISGGK